MMKSALFLASACASLFSSVAFASPSQYSCTLVDEFDDWSLVINLDSAQAEFFDNDHWSTLTLSETNFIETLPVTTEYIFKGTDSMNSSANFVLNFDVRNDTTRAMFTEKSSDGTQESYEFTCQAN